MPTLTTVLPSRVPSNASTGTRQRGFGGAKEKVKRLRAIPVYEYPVTMGLTRRLDLSACDILRYVACVPLLLAGFRDAARWMRKAIATTVWPMSRHDLLSAG